MLARYDRGAESETLEAGLPDPEAPASGSIFATSTDPDPPHENFQRKLPRTMYTRSNISNQGFRRRYVRVSVAATSVNECPVFSTSDLNQTGLALVVHIRYSTRP